MMRRFGQIAGMMAALLMTASASEASQRLRVEYNDYEMQGSSTLHLKRDLRTVYRQVDFDNVDLLRVTVIAKSRYGQGDVQLVIGRDFTEHRNVGGNPRDFYDRREWTFDHVEFVPYNYRDRGPWQVLLNGNIIIRAVEVEIEDYYSRPNPGRPAPYPGYPQPDPGYPQPGRPGPGYPPPPPAQNFQYVYSAYGTQCGSGGPQIAPPGLGSRVPAGCSMYCGTDWRWYPTCQKVYLDPYGRPTGQYENVDDNMYTCGNRQGSPGTCNP